MNRIFLLVAFLFVSLKSMAADPAWPDYRILDANGVLKVLADVMGPASSDPSYSTANNINWGFSPYLKIQQQYPDLGANCDLNNPHKALSGEAVDPPFTHSNGTASSVSQNGTYTTCYTNPSYSKNGYTPKALLTRVAWMYRLCRMITTKSTATQVTKMALRVRQADPVASTTATQVKFETFKTDGSNLVSPPPFNWCNPISSPSGKDLQSLFRAFYPGRVIPQLTKQTVNVGSGASAPMNPYPLYLETLLDLIDASNEEIDSFTNAESNTFEERCTPYGAYPTRDKVKAVNAWRAVFMTMCMDPGWGVL